MARPRAYQVDELLKLRRACKDPSDVVRRINSEAGIKEHVLRSSSNGSDPYPLRSRQRSASIITNPYDGFEVPPPDDCVPYKNKHVQATAAARPPKISPTPSVKRGKAEKLLKEHGSPPGVRVTAGGRIVPDGLTPIASPRLAPRGTASSQQQQQQQLANINIPRVDLRNLPSVSYLQSVEGYLVLAEGQIFQVHNGHLIPVGRIGSSTLNLLCPPANQVVAPGSTYGAGVDFQIPMHQMASSMYPPNPEHEAIDQGTLNELNEAHAKLQMDLRELDRNEVLQRDSLTLAAKRDIVRRRIDLVNRMDETRRSLMRAQKVLKERAANAQPLENMQNTSASHVFAPQQIMSMPVPLTYSFSPEFAYSASPEFAHFPVVTPMMHHNFPYSMPGQGVSPTFGSMPTAYPSYSENAGFTELQARAGNVGLGIGADSSGNAHQQENINVVSKSVPGSGSGTATSINLDGSGHQPRRSHAVAIRAPESAPVAKDKKPTLDPQSSDYQPRGTAEGNNMASYAAADLTHREHTPFQPSSAMAADVDRLVESPRLAHGGLDNTTDSSARLHASTSTASTADFFPRDTNDYSSTKHSYEVNSPSQAGLGGWMSGELPSKPLSTPQRASNKHVWNTSPEEHFFDALPGHEDRPQTAFGGLSPFDAPSASKALPSPRGMEHANRLSAALISTPEKDHLHSVAFQHHAREASVIGGESPAARRPSGSQHVTPRLQRTDSGNPLLTRSTRSLYRLGFEDGLKQKLDGAYSELAYLQGLREGLQEYTRRRSARGSLPPSFMATDMQELLSSATQGHVDDRVSDENRPNLGSSDRRGSIPSFGSPAVPVNSPLGTPRTASSSFEGKFSPATALAFSSRPNVKVVDMQRGIGTQTSASRLQGSGQQTSPLADRRPAVSFGGINSGGGGGNVMDLLEDRAFRIQLEQKKVDVDPSKPHRRTVVSTAPFAMRAQQRFPGASPWKDGPSDSALPKTHEERQQSQHRAIASPVPIPAGSNSPCKRLTSAAATFLAFGRKLKSPEPPAEQQPQPPLSPCSSRSCSPSKSRMGWRRRAGPNTGAGSPSVSPN